MSNVLPSIMAPGSFENYEISEKLSTERYSVRYSAHNTVDERPVVLKVVNEETEASVKAMFMNNHRKLATINHPNVSRIFRVDEVDGISFIEEELMVGSMRELIYSKQALHEIEALTMIRDVASALSIVHSQAAVSHLNINPKSIRFDQDGLPKICDFCQHRIIESDKRLIGVPKYVSPEAILYATSSDGAPPPGPQADVFSLGVTLYRLLSKQSPYIGEPMQLIKARFTEKPEPLSKWGAFDAGTVQIVERMMALKLTERHTGMSDVFDALNDQISHLRKMMGNEQVETSDFELKVIGDDQVENEESGPHVINPQVLSKAVDDLFEAGALEYAAPADESARGSIVIPKSLQDKSSEEKTEPEQGSVAIIALETEKADPIPNEEISLKTEDEVAQDSEVVQDSEMASEGKSESEPETKKDLAPDSDPEPMPVVTEATLSQALQSKVRETPVTRSSNRSRHQKARTTSAATFYMKAIGIFILGLVGAMAGFFMVRHFMKDAQRDTVQISQVPLPIQSSMPSRSLGGMGSRMIDRRPVDIVIEGEHCLINGNPSDVKMAGHQNEKLSGGRHLLWTLQKVGEQLEIKFDTNQAASGLVLGLSRNKLYGRFDIYLNNIKIASDVDLYAAELDRSKDLAINNLHLKAGAHTLLFISTGKPQSSSVGMFGLDYIGLNVAQK